jgi:hypothetical protein
MFDVTAAGYQVRPPLRVAIVGAGGGRDILTALASGAKSIDAIELNAGIVETVNGVLGDFSGHVYDLDGVHAIIGEGRSVLTRSKGGYDLIQISLIDSWAATAAGAYSLCENNLYTVEAYQLYLSKLSLNGIVSTSRWTRGQFGMELPRLVFLVREALIRQGVARPMDHIAVFQGGAIGTVLVSNTPWTDHDVHALERVAAMRGFILHLPPELLAPEYRQLERVVQAGPRAFAADGIFLDPPTDDTPFFFQVLSPFRSCDARVVKANGINGEGVAALRMLMFSMTAITAALFFAPFALGRRLRRDAGFWRSSVYFTCIGLAFLFVEISWVQRLVLFLGHPSMATTAGLGCLLLGAGMGSMSAARVGVARARRMGPVLGAAIALCNTIFTPLFKAAIGMPLAARLAITALAVVPVGAMMGVCFPIGMARFGDTSKPWLWSINGAAGLLASVASLALAMEFGLRNVGYLGAVLYLVAWVALLGEARHCDGS